MQPPMKYQPYHGYGCAHPFLGYTAVSVNKRIRTRSDWRYPSRESGYDHDWHALSRPNAWSVTRCHRCGHTHCDHCRCYTPWKRYAKESNGSTYEKRRVHRLFRRAARVAILAELDGSEDVSHAFIISGDYLD